jgi:hypothetical protein
VQSSQKYTGRNLIEVGQSVKTMGGGRVMTVAAIDCCGHELIATCIRRNRKCEVQDFYSIDDLEPVAALATSLMRTFQT